MKRYRLAAALGLAAILVAPAISYGAGLWTNLPQIGGASYCASFNATGPTVGGNTGQAGVGFCAQTVPAGPATFAGTEYAPFDIGPLGGATSSPPSTANVSVLQLGQGPMVDVTSPATATIPANTPWYFLDGAQGSAFTITMPASPVEGQIQRVTCEAATVGALTVAANSGQTLKGNPAAACVLGTTYSWRWQASNTTWYRF